ncbi:MAG TPA: winged helix-turn-helix domain-containing protein [Steroidobacteraceae bacterium]|nr:winged helix-turn-helix domain-containing protein [Steroidobacteraceae bacterium]
MDRLTSIALQVGAWRIDPQLGQMSCGTQTVRLEARTLRLLMYLANRAGETVGIDELLDQVWSGVVVTQDSVYQAVTALRRLLGDDAKNPTYIVTVPRLGYRLIAPVRAAADEPLVPPPSLPEPRAFLSRRILLACAAIVLAGIAVFVWHGATPDAKSVAVLPFLDLTSQAMNEEYFADGLTEELIGRLSSEAGFKVPAASSSFFYKNQELPPSQIARELGVAYLLEGSLRESGDTLRITARLTRAADGYVLWTKNFERPKADRLQIQDEIAREVVVALRETVH